MKKYCFIILFFTSLTSFSQSFVDTYKFSEYLFEKKLYSDLIYHLHSVDTSYEWSISQNDSLNYLLGLTYYSRKELASSVKYFSKVSSLSPYYYKSKFLQQYNLAHLHDYEQADSVLNELPGKDSLVIALKNLENAGIALLRRDLEAFKNYESGFEGKYYQLSKQEENLSLLAHKIQTEKKKSPVVAGVLSGVVPGLGKIYAGKVGQGVVIFLQQLAFGLQAYEGYRKNGFESRQLYIFGGIFTLFHVGNIWGSVLSVKIKSMEVNDQINNSILFNMHIPIRTIYN